MNSRKVGLASRANSGHIEPTGPLKFSKEFPYDGNSQNFYAFRDQLLKEAMRTPVKNFHRATPEDLHFYDPNQPANRQRLVQDPVTSATAKKMFLEENFAAEMPMAGIPPIPGDLEAAMIPFWTLQIKQEEANWKLFDQANTSKRAAEAQMIKYLREITTGSIPEVLDKLIEDGRGTLPIIYAELTQRYSNRHLKAIHEAALNKFNSPMEVSNFHLLIDIRRQREIDFHKESRIPAPGNVYIPQSDEELAYRLYTDLTLAFNGQSVLKIPSHYMEGFRNFEEDHELAQGTTYVQLLNKLKQHMDNVDRQRQKVGLKSSFKVSKLDIGSLEEDSQKGNNIKLNKVELNLIENFKKLKESAKKKIVDSTHEARQTGICYQFSKTGACIRGDSCKYEHMLGGGKNAGPNNEKSVTCTKDRRCGLVDCTVCLTAKMQAQSATAQKGNGVPRWEAANFLCVAQQNGERLDVDVHRANVADGKSSSASTMQLDSGCNSTAISPEGAEKLARRVDTLTRGPKCTTASGEVLSVVAKAHLISPFGAAHVVEGLQHNLASVRDITGRGCSVWFPSLDMGLKWGAYVYDGEGRIVAVADQAEYLMEPLTMQEQVRGMPKITQPNMFA